MNFILYNLKIYLINRNFLKLIRLFFKLKNLIEFLSSLIAPIPNDLSKKSKILFALNILFYIDQKILILHYINSE
jgi:hypothetical protein